jgi:hypothetical protein
MIHFEWDSSSSWLLATKRQQTPSFVTGNELEEYHVNQTTKAEDAIHCFSIDRLIIIHTCHAKSLE